jgi:hypothetical protein
MPLQVSLGTPQNTVYLQPRYLFDVMFRVSDTTTDLRTVCVTVNVK